MREADMLRHDDFGEFIRKRREQQYSHLFGKSLRRFAVALGFDPECISYETLKSLAIAWEVCPDSPKYDEVREEFRQSMERHILEFLRKAKKS